MGTSGAYGGSSGWDSIAKDTQAWIDGSHPYISNDDEANGDSDLSAQPLSAVPSPPILKIIGNLARLLSVSGGGGGVVAGNRFVGSSGRGGSSRSPRSLVQASGAGGRAAAGVYALRGGSVAGLTELGLSLDELSGLSLWEQAQKLQDAATAPSGEISDSELRQANANLIIWALYEEEPPTPLELANRWVIEYVWQVWVTEAGKRLGDGVDSVGDRRQFEEEIRAALEILVLAGGLPDDRPLFAADFEQAIASVLNQLCRIERAPE